ncbi:MAG: alpha-amylase family glycosyl hydrolase [Acidimicrobiales bacterium]|nr:hypothetical protein [Acidimicrobiales bacterium]
MTSRSIYFVMPDRFDNADPTNDTGGIEGGPLDHGFLPTDKGFFNGGDLQGVIGRLDYLQGMGVTALWLTPPFTNNPVQGSGEITSSSAGYHGYWQIDFDNVDPHLGTNEDLRQLVDEAHERGMLVFLDAVVNHTGDVITYADGSFVYWSTSARPYLDSEGNPVDLAELAGVTDPDHWPLFDPATSFPHIPTFASPDLATIKSPAWLNDVTLYHNRGNTTFNGESDTLGDFFGLDDLMTEHPLVVQGMVDIYSDIVDRFGVDGFRVDTMKHVNIEFWQQWAPALQAAAERSGNDDFFIFGEVANTSPILQSSFTNVGVSSTLDFIFNAAVSAYAGGGGGDLLVQAFDKDDWFTDADNNASMQVKFFGNHDQGRMGMQIRNQNPSASDEVLTERMRLGFDLLFLTRGVPVVYYGDEQGFAGSGGDKLARAPMFPAQSDEFIDDDNIGSDATPGDDNFDPDHPLYRHIAQLNELRSQHPTLVTGAQIVHDAPGPVFAFSRFDRDERTEYLVVTNSNASLSVPARFQALTPDTTFVPVWTRSEAVVEPVMSDSTGEVLVDIAPLATVVFRAERTLAPVETGPEIALSRPNDGAEIPSYRYRIEADVSASRHAEVTFAVSVDGATPEVIGVDDAAPYRVYWDNSHLNPGATLEIIATVVDGDSAPRADRATATIGDRQ